MKHYVLDLGKIVMKGANPVLDEPDAEAAIPIHAFLLDTPEGCILFDAGCHPKAMEGAWPPELCGNPYVTGPGENLPDQLARIGVDPGRITKVVLSHLHLDHAGGVHLFPQADVYVHQRELEQVMSDAAAGTLDLFHVQCDVDSWKAAGTRWVPVSADAGETPLCPGVTILNLGPGHLRSSRSGSSRNSTACVQRFRHWRPRLWIRSAGRERRRTAAGSWSGV